MCGIVGAIAERNVVPILMEGLRRLEYRGYDSAGLAVLNGSKHLSRLRTVGKVKMLEEALEQAPVSGKVGIAHTRWATHGVPSERNAHPHISLDGLAIVHNGIIENHEELREELKRLGYTFTSETDTEVVAHRIHHHLATIKDLFKAVRATVAELEGAYALAVVSENDPDRLILAREGCPVVVGLGVEENFVASDVSALLPVTRRFMFLEEGDVAEVRRKSIRVIDKEGNGVERPIRESELSADAADKGQYRHYMLKEIHEQPLAIANTLEERVANGRLLEAAFGPAATEVLKHTQNVHIVACGTSYHAACVARYFIEQICKVPCAVDIASEYRYRNPLVPPNSLFCNDLAIGRDRGHPGGAATREAVGLPVLAVDLQRARELTGARVRARHADARRPGNRRSVDESLHHAARGSLHVRHRAGEASRCGCRTGARSREPSHRVARPGGADARVGSGRPQARGTVR